VPGGFRPIGNVANATHTALEQGWVALGEFLGGVCDDELRAGHRSSQPVHRSAGEIRATAPRAFPQLRLGPVPVRLVGPAFSGLGGLLLAAKGGHLRGYRWLTPR